MNAGGPPPGGYGFGPPPGPGSHEPTQSSGGSSGAGADAPSNASGQGSPFAAPPPASYQPTYSASPSSGGGMKKIGLPILGISVLCIRVLLLCGRAASSSSSFDQHAYPSYNPPVPALSLGLPDFAGLANATATAAPGAFAVSQETGDIYFAIGEELHRHDAAGKSSSATLEGAPRLLVAAGKRVCWSTFSQSVLCRAADFEDTPMQVGSASGSITALALDAQAAYAVVYGSPDTEGNQLLRFDLKTKKMTTIVAAGKFQYLTVDGGFLYWLDSEHAESDKPVAIVRMPVTGGKQQIVLALATEPERMVVKGDEVYFSRFAKSDGSQRCFDIARVAGSGGTPVVLNLGDKFLRSGEGRFDVGAKSIVFVAADGSLYKAPRAGGVPVHLASPDDSVESLGIAKNNAIYWEAHALLPSFARVKE